MRTLSHHCEYFSILSPPYSKAAPSDPKPDFDDAFDDSAAAAASGMAREISRKAAGGKGSQADRDGGLMRQAKEEEEDGPKMGKDNLVGGSKDIG